MTNEQIKTFLTAGRAVFTLKSRKTGTHFTYKIVQKQLANTVYFVSVLRGSEEWTYLGMFDAKRGVVRPTKNSKVEPSAPSFNAINWFLRHLGAEQLEFKHEGKCCRCGRPLTHPDSIDSGIGPECAKKVGAARVERKPTLSAQSEALPVLQALCADNLPKRCGKPLLNGHACNLPVGHNLVPTSRCEWAGDNEAYVAPKRPLSLQCALELSVEAVKAARETPDSRAADGPRFYNFDTLGALPGES